MNKTCTFTQEATADITRFDWGRICMLINPPVATGVRFGSVTVRSGALGHELHHHTNEDEIIYIVSGDGIFATETEKRQVHAGDCIFVPAGIAHTTSNSGADNMNIIIVYIPAR